MQPLQPGHVETGRSVSPHPSPLLRPFPATFPASVSFQSLPASAFPRPGRPSARHSHTFCPRTPSGLCPSASFWARSAHGPLIAPPPRRRHTRVFDGLAVGAWVCVCSGPYVLRAHCTPHGPILSVRVCSVSPVLRCLLLLPVAVFLVPFQRSFFLGSRRG